jgi:hypothetical protein
MIIIIELEKLILKLIFVYSVVDKIFRLLFYFIKKFIFDLISDKKFTLIDEFEDIFL